MLSREKASGGKLCGEEAWIRMGNSSLGLEVLSAASLRVAEKAWQELKENPLSKISPGHADRQCSAIYCLEMLINFCGDGDMAVPG